MTCSARSRGLPKEGALALGMNDWEVVRKVSLPWVRSGIIGAAVLGVGKGARRDDRRRHGLGHDPGPSSIQPLRGNEHHCRHHCATTRRALSDGTGFEVRTLAEFALVLVAITLLTNLGARRLVSKAAAATALPVGRGV